MADIERELQQAPLRRFVDRPGELFAATYRGDAGGLGALGSAADRGARRPVPPDAREVETLLARVDDRRSGR